MSEVTDSENQTAPIEERDAAPVHGSVGDDKTLTTAELAGATDKAPTEAVAKANGGGGPAESGTPLLAQDESADLKRRWDAIQASFVDEPRHAVEEADNLVANAMKRLAEVFASERSNLEGQWDRGDDVSTEDLRVALRRYRSFFGRLLAV